MTWFQICTAMAGGIALILAVLAGLRRPTFQGFGETAGHPLSLYAVFVIFASLVAVVTIGFVAVAFWEADAAGRAEILRSLRTFSFLFLAMVAGMLASVLVGQIRAGEDSVPLTRLIMPLAASVLVFGSFWAGLSGRPDGPMALLAAFESGFGWEAFLNRFPAPIKPSHPVTVRTRAALRP